MFDTQFNMMFEVGDGAIINTQVGFMSSEVSENIADDPSYEELESGILGHTQVVKVEYNRKKVQFIDLCKFFFQIHDSSVFGFQIG